MQKMTGWGSIGVAVCTVLIFSWALTLNAMTVKSIFGAVSTGQDKIFLSGVVVKIMNVKTEQFFASQPTDSKGKYTLVDVPDGIYKVGVSSSEGDYLLNDAVAIAHYGDTPMDISIDKSDPLPAEVSSSEPVKGRISLRFQWDTDKTSVRGAKIYLKNIAEKKTYKGSVTDSEGCSFTPKDLKEIPAGEYELIIQYNDTKFPYHGIIRAQQKTGSFIAAECYNLVEPDNILVPLKKDCGNCDLTSYLLVPWWKTPIGIATIAGAAGTVGVGIIVWPTPKEASPSHP